MDICVCVRVCICPCERVGKSGLSSSRDTKAEIAGKNGLPSLSCCEHHKEKTVWSKGGQHPNILWFLLIHLVRCIENARHKYKRDCRTSKQTKKALSKSWKKAQYSIGRDVDD